MNPVLREFVIDGTRALAFSTGGGLDFAVLVDRSLDIGPLRWRDRAVGWVGPARFRHPAGHDPHADEGRGFNRLFSGFLVTGGLEHIRQPANGHPLHGSLPFTPANLTCIGFADTGRVLHCEGEVQQPGFRLKRRIEAPVGGNSLTITDVVENLAAMPRHQASLYHFNIGQPTLADGTVVKQGSQQRLGPLRVPDAGLASVSVGHPVIGGHGTCTVETPDCTITFTWDAATLPYLQLWHRLNADPPVLSIEPCTSERLPGGLSGAEPILAPGEARCYRLQVSFGA
jgi:Domain of unknown function (DUF4432)